MKLIEHLRSKMMEESRFLHAWSWHKARCFLLYKALNSYYLSLLVIILSNYALFVPIIILVVIIVWSYWLIHIWLWRKKPCLVYIKFTTMWLIQIQNHLKQINVQLNKNIHTKLNIYRDHLRENVSIIGV